MAVAVGIILMWGGSVATIPSGWVRETSLDGKFPKATAAGTDPNVTGGTATHTHTSPVHSHTMATHSHIVHLSNVDRPSSNSSDSSGSEGVPGNHSHDVSIGGVSGGDLSSVASTYGAVSNNPPYHDLIFIKPNATPADLAADIITLWNVSSIPTGWSFCNGANGTPDLRNKYIHGAAADQNAGATGGSYTNIHSLIHTHTEAGHTHLGSTAGQITDAGGRRGTSGSGRLARGHTHNVSLNANSAGGISLVTLTTQETVEPAYKKILAIKNTTGGVDQPQAIIGLYLGTLATIPAGWSLCDGNNGTPDLRDKFIKIAYDSSELGFTGGSNTHTHASQQHSHTGNSHTHTGNNTDDHLGKNTIAPVGGSLVLQDDGVAHSVLSVEGAIASWNAASTTADSASNEPEYRTVAYVMWTGTPVSDNRPAEILGKISTNDERSSELIGVNPAEDRDAQIHGKEADNNERICEVRGMLVWSREEKAKADVVYMPNET